MQRQDSSPSTLRFLWDMFTCNTPQKPLLDEEELLLNPSEPNFSDKETSSEDTPAENNLNDFELGLVDAIEALPVSIDSNDGFYTEVYDVFGECSNVACCVCLLPIGLCSCAGLVIGCAPAYFLPATVVAAWTPVEQAVMLVALPFGSMFTGYAAGALCWGKSTEAAQRWVGKRIEQNKSTSVCGFFTSCCESQERPETQSAPVRMSRL